MARPFKRVGLAATPSRGRSRRTKFALALPVPLYSLKVRAVFGHLLIIPEPGAPDLEGPRIGETARDATG